jgi:hypothetical protein
VPTFWRLATMSIHKVQWFPWSIFIFCKITRYLNFFIPHLETWQSILPVDRKKKCMLARHTKHMSFLIQVWLSIENSQSESWQIVQCGFWQQFFGVQIHHVLRGFPKSMAIRVMEFLNGGYKIWKIFA